MEQPIDSNLIKDYQLTVRLNPEGFTISVFDDFNVLLSTKKVSVSLFSLSSNEIIKLLTPETQLNYSTVSFICESNTYIFIPAPVFIKEEAADMLHFQFKPGKNDQNMLNRIPMWDTVNVFSIPKTVHSALKQMFPDAIIEHHLSYLLTECVKPQPVNCVYIEVRSTIMDVVVICRGGIQLINSYTFNTPEDFTYYVLNLFDKLPLDTDDCQVILFNADKKPELQKTLEQYLEVTKGER